MRFIRDALAKNMMNPERGILGFLASRMFKKKNTFLEQNAVKLCDLAPNMNVLEVGFGPGIGLEEACKRIQAGSGVVYGVDISDYMLSMAGRRLQKEIASGLVYLYHASVYNIPADSSYFDRIFHCNVYQFWRDQGRAADELYRVLRSGGLMVTTLNLSSLRLAKKRGLLKYGNIDPLRYMQQLEGAGFSDVHIEYKLDEDAAADYQAIFARKP